MTEEELLKNLNPQQREAVLINNGSLLVFAGAGSGKTRVITTKIAYAIQKGIVKPYQILAVTFTNKACREMQERVDSLLNSNENDLFNDNSKPLIKTFHSFGTYLLRKYGSKVGMVDNFTIYDDKESLALLSQCFPEEDASDLKEKSSLIALVKEKNELPQEKSDFIRYYNAYQSALEKSGNADFGDLIIKPIRLLKENPEVKQQIQNRFKYILVDEYQDTNPSQFELLRELVGPDTFICVVGDDDQSIYGFRSASVKTILNFPKQFENTKTVVLGTNYRCSDKILNVAKAIVEKNEIRAKKELNAANRSNVLPVLTQCGYDIDEARDIAKTIMSKPETIGSTAILYRKNAQSKKLEAALSDNMIPYRIVGDVGFYKREEVKDVVSLLCFIFNMRDAVAFQRVVNKPNRGVGEKTVEKIISYAQSNNQDLLTSSKTCIQNGTVKGLAAPGLTNFIEKIETVSKKIGEVPNDEFTTILANEFGLLTYYTERDKEEKKLDSSRVENIKTLVNELKEEPYSDGFTGFIQWIEKIALESSREDVNDKKPRVSLMTMHAAKGLEFDRVFVTGLEEEIMISPKDTRTEIEEERRLVYVAMTRAKSELYLSYATYRNLYNGSVYSHKLSFLDDIPQSSYTFRKVGIEFKNQFNNYNQYSGYGNRYTNDYGGNNYYYKKTVKESDPYESYVPLKPKATLVKKASLQNTKKNTAFKFEIGERVKHEMLGEGTITALKNFGTRDTVIVTFDSGKMGTYLKEKFDFEKLDS